MCGSCQGRARCLDKGKRGAQCRSPPCIPAPHTMGLLRESTGRDERGNRGSKPQMLLSEGLGTMLPSPAPRGVQGRLVFSTLKCLPAVGPGVRA